MLGHVGAAVEFGTRLLCGEQPEWHPVDPPGQTVSGDPVSWWSAKVEPAKAAVRDIDLTREVDSPAGRRSIGQGLSFPAVDLFVHGWDLARSSSRDVEIPEEAIEFTHRALDGFPPEQVRSPRVFGAAVELPADPTAGQHSSAGPAVTRDRRPNSAARPPIVARDSRGRRSRKHCVIG